MLRNGVLSILGKVASFGGPVLAAIPSGISNGTRSILFLYTLEGRSISIVNLIMERHALRSSALQKRRMPIPANHVKNIALVGAARGIGSLIARELLRQPSYSLTALTRTSSTSHASIPSASTSQKPSCRTRTHSRPPSPDRTS